MLKVNNYYIRADIPPFFDLEFNMGSWMNGHVCPKVSPDQFLFITMKKADLYVYNNGSSLGRAEYADQVNNKTINWSSQQSTTAESKKGQAIINHVKNGSNIHVFVRDKKLGSNGKAAPFKYLGRAKYTSHQGDQPMQIRFKLEDQ